MATLASSSNSSLDLLATDHTDPRSSPLRDTYRAFKRTPTPSRSIRGTPSRGSQVSQLQDFYLDTPRAGQIDPVSPVRSVAEAVDVISPWRIRVRVEAERDDATNTGQLHSLRRSMTPSRARANATTVVVPLNDESDDNVTRTKRARKSTTKRPATPRHMKGRKRVLDEVENEAMQRRDTPKRTKRQSTPKAELHASVEDDEEPRVLHLDDLLEAALTPEPENDNGTTRRSTRRSLSLSTEPAPVMDGAAVQSSNRRGRITSPFEFRRQGQDVSVVRIKDSTNNPVKNRRRLLISDFAEPRLDFDSIVEGEDFSMVSLSSIPSAQQHLSQKKATKPSSPRSTVAAQSSAESLRKPSTIESPTIIGKTGVFQSRYTGRRANTSLLGVDDTLHLTPARTAANSKSGQSLRTTVQSSSSIDRSGNITRENRYEGNDQQRNDSSSEHSAILDQPDRSREEVGTALKETPDSEDTPNSNQMEEQPDEAVPEVVDDFIDYGGFDSDNDEADRHAHPPNEGLDLDSEVEDEAHQEEVERLERLASEEPLHQPVVRQSSTDRPQSFTQHPMQSASGNYAEAKVRGHDQSSLLQLPQKSRTPSRLYSSPMLPDLPSQQSKPLKPLPKSSVSSPKLTRVVNAGRALQDVVEPSSAQLSRNSSQRNSIEPQRHDLFSGFSVATRRDLRAGLRLGEELAKKQSSMLDITMKSVSSQGHQAANVPPTTPPQHRPVSKLEVGQAVNYPDLFAPKQIQLLSPETSSNDENKDKSLAQDDAKAQTRGTETLTVQYPSNEELSRNLTQASFRPHASATRQSQIAHPVSEDAELEIAEEENGVLDEPASDQEYPDETDIWQLEAKSTSILEPQEQPSDHVPSRTRPNGHSSDFDDIDPDPYAEDVDDAEDQEQDELEVHDFDEEEAAAVSSRINTPGKLSGMFTPSDTTSSPAAKGRGRKVDFTDFTGFTRDLLQAANRRPVPAPARQIDALIEERTPATKVMQENQNPYANVFTTKSLLDASNGSVKTPRFSPRKPFSFRPSNRKESWLLDPTRARKPPSPLKSAMKMRSVAEIPRGISPLVPARSQNPAAEVQINKRSARFDVDNTPDAIPGEDSTEEDEHVDPGAQDVQATPELEPRLDDSSPLSIFVAAQKRKADAQNRKSPTVTETKPNRPIQQSNRVEKTQSKRPARAFLKPTDNVQHYQKPMTRPRPIPQPTSSAQASSQHSSFISNASSHTSYTSEEASTSWFTLLSNAATPILSAPKILSNLAAAAFTHSQQQTFHPVRPALPTQPAVLTIHHPFNDTHWSSLRTIYLSALKHPHKFPLNLRSHSADYLGLEVSSLGWKRCLEEWELSVVTQFLLLLDAEGLETDPDADLIDVEDVIKRVFSLWVGMVTRAELELRDGKAGAWDRRFVSKRDLVLGKQKSWLATRREHEIGS